jgi:ADP-ribose pyrophosphatase
MVFGGRMTVKKADTRWIQESERALLSSPFMSLFELSCRSRAEPEKRHRFYVMRSRDWCNIIPVTEDGKVVLVRQHRMGTDADSLEIPGGVADQEGEALREAALRELAEETGYVPLPGARCEALGATFSNPAILDNRVHAFVVGPVRRERAQELDAGEMIEVAEVPIAEIPSLIQRGELSHSLILPTFLFLALRDPRAADALRDGLRGYSTA